MKTEKNQGHNGQERRAISLSAAQSALLQHVKRASVIRVSLEEADGFRLAKDVYTSAPIPHFRRSGMDGYAVRSEDMGLLPKKLAVIERIACGTPPEHEVVSGTAARIMTGGMVPVGADTVIMQEMTEAVEASAGQSYVQINHAVPAGTNLTSVGQEAEAGERILKQGEAIGAAQAALLAVLGCAEVEVYRKPIVAILSTGDELLAVSEPLLPGKVRNSNLYMLAAQIRSYGGEPRLIGQISDEPQEARRMLDETLAGEADIVLTTGGVSVGDFDVMAHLFATWEGHTLFNKITMRPGSPTSAGVMNGKLLIGLSGNPAACYIGCELLVRPILRQLQGERAMTIEEHQEQAILTGEYPKVNAYTRYVRGIRYTEGARVYVRQEGADRSSAIVSLKDANCLMVIPPTKTVIPSGTLVTIIPL